jgi:rsbT co-antagonist protein RsbR
MSKSGLRAISALMGTNESSITQGWLTTLKQDGATQSGRIGESELLAQMRSFLAALRGGFDSDSSEVNSPAYEAARELLAEMSRSRAVQGFSPRETAMFVFSLKQPLRAAGSGAAHAEALLLASDVLDDLGLHTLEVFQKSREEVIIRQQQEISELSTPVIKLWEGILALPLIGTLDSQRTQVVMENLLEAIVQQGADTAIIDITGVPTVDTLTAQHLLKTIAAARLMGADCIISGIRPQIAQTMVHLGVELTVVSKATLADAFAVALAKQGRGVFRRSALGAAPSTLRP